ncbi:hypothetical protein COV19_01825 [Candidatus Woesearchaeota archaeon CG10_big_fil_rev_8_21_14_0_10_44_13]|nr:MAG: hypothetical protein COV19_01825 [Candidatus Woesearchaeota archaeon CG10_big_fil_rev_8_21_14_0_10_44_13]
MIAWIKRSHINLAVISFLAVYSLIQLAGLSGFYPYGWDESVYLQAGRYIISGGNDGFLENLRPLFFPLMLAPFSYSIFMSRLFVLALSIAALWIVYKIAGKHLDPTLSWILPVIMAVFPFYYLSSNSILTEIPGLFLHVLCIYLFFEKKYFFSGMTAFLAFFTRFTSGIYLPLLFIGVLFLEKRKDMFRSASMFILGAVVGSSSFLVNTYLFYPETKDVFIATIYPILNQFGFIFTGDEGLLFYPGYMLRWTVLSVFAIAGIFFILRPFISGLINGEKTGDPLKKKVIVLALALLPFSYLLIAPHKEIRYLIIILPWIAYLMCFGIAETIRLIMRNIPKKRRKTASAAIFIVLAFMSLSMILDSAALVREFYYAPEQLYDDYYFALKGLPHDNKILTSLPMIQTGARIVIGYYDTGYFYEKLNQDDYDYVYYTTEWLPCAKDDPGCLKIRESTLDNLEKNYALYLNYSFYNSDFLIYSRKGLGGNIIKRY